MSLETRDELESHVKSMHGAQSIIERFVCEKCSKIFNLKDDMEEHAKTHDNVMKCNSCVFEATNDGELREHVKDKHKQREGNCQKKCKEFDILDRNYKLLKENYERLVTINKNLQNQAKDREYAQDVLQAELRTNYDSAKAENIKLNDSLETQHKMWKIWLEKFDDKKEVPAPAPNENQEAPIVDEPVEEIEILENDDEDIVDNEEIFQRFLINRERGFKRSTPAADPVPSKSKNFKCEVCGFSAMNNNVLKDHTARVHTSTKPNVGNNQTEKDNSNSRKSGQPLYCHYWNNFGTCKFEEKNGRPCKFEHKKAPRCNFDGKCTRKSCMFSHQNQNIDFLGKRNQAFRPSPVQQPWQILMEALGMPRMAGNGQSRRGNQKRF